MEKIQLQPPVLNRQPTAQPTAQGLAQDFGNALGKALEQVDQMQKQADSGIVKLQSGQDASLPEVMINMEQADISMRLLVQMRNRVVEAYQEIMRMQV